MLLLSTSALTPRYVLSSGESFGAAATDVHHVTPVVGRADSHPSGGSASGLSSIVHRADASGRQQTSQVGAGGAGGAGGSAGRSGSRYRPAGRAARRAPPARKPGWKRMFGLCRDPSAVDVRDAGDREEDGREFSLLPPQIEIDAGKKLLVLDLDETLVHSSFKPVPNPDYIIPVEIEGTVHHVYVVKRPGCDYFLEKIANKWEIVVFTASLSKYADPLLDQLDVHKCVRSRLFREHCVFHNGNYVKDLNQMGRDIKQIIIVDNSPASYLFHPENAIPCESFIDDMSDRELYDMVPFLDSIIDAPDVRTVLGKWRKFPRS